MTDNNLAARLEHAEWKLGQARKEIESLRKQVEWLRAERLRLHKLTRRAGIVQTSARWGELKPKHYNPA